MEVASHSRAPLAFNENCIASFITALTLHWRCPYCWVSITFKYSFHTITEPLSDVHDIPSSVVLILDGNVAPNPKCEEEFRCKLFTQQDSLVLTFRGNRPDLAWGVGGDYPKTEPGQGVPNPAPPQTGPGQDISLSPTPGPGIPYSSSPIP